MAKQIYSKNTDILVDSPKIGGINLQNESKSGLKTIYRVRRVFTKVEMSNEIVEVPITPKKIEK